MYKFYTWDISVKFTLFITVVYVTGNYGFVKSKQLCHLTLCEPHCISFMFSWMLPSWERYISIALFIFCDH